MFETSGALTNVEPVSTLVLLFLLPVLWAIVSIVFRTRDGLIARVAIAMSGGMLTLAITLAMRLSSLPRGSVLVQHVAQLGRLGQLDLAFDLMLDPKGAAFAIIVALLAFSSVLHTAWSPRPAIADALACAGILASSALLLCTADGFAPLLVGASGVSLGAWSLWRDRRDDSSVIAFGGNVAVALGLFMLYWSLGGSFGPAGYDADAAPRIVLVATGPAPADRTTLSMSTLAGARVSSDEGPGLPGEPLTTPFTVALEPGVYTFRIEGGAATADVLVPHVAITQGQAYTLTPYGPTTSVRNLADQIAAPRIASTGGQVPVRALLAARSLGGVRASLLIIFLLVCAPLAQAHALSARRGPAALAATLEILPAAYFALRFAPLVDASSLDGGLVTLAGSISAFLLGGRAAAADDPAQAMRCVLGAATSIAVGAVGLGEPAAALVLSASSLVACGAALAAVEGRRDVRWLGVACAAAVGLLPGAGTSPGFALTLTSSLNAALHGARAGEGLATSAAAGIASALSMLAWAFCALAAFRVYDAVIRSSLRDPGTRGQAAVVTLLAVLALGGGVILGAGTTAFGGQVIPLARRIVGDATADAAPRPIAAAAIALSIVTAATGVLLARRVGAGPQTPRWLRTLSAPHGAAMRLLAVGTRGFGFLQRSVVRMDRDVVEDFGVAVTEVFGRLARVVRPPGAHPDPQRAQRITTAIVLVLLALFALLVLSSMVLG